MLYCTDSIAVNQQVVSRPNLITPTLCFSRHITFLDSIDPVIGDGQDIDKVLPDYCNKYNITQQSMATSEGVDAAIVTDGIAWSV